MRISFNREGTMYQGDPFAAIDSRRYWQNAHRRAVLQQITALVKQCSIDLLPFEEVRTRLHLHQQLDRGIQSIQIARIVGSVGRYNDFTYDFMPRNAHVQERWERVEQHVVLTGGPPIEVYQVGEVYFVLDGNHRVSVAHALGLETIEAQVWEFSTPVGLSAKATMDEVLAKAEYLDFLAKTQIDEIDSDVQIELTCAGGYNDLATQIDAYRQRFAPGEDHPDAYRQALRAWYTDIYQPGIAIIRQSGIMADFPGRTEADLFVWVWQNHEDLERLNLAELDLSAELRHWRQPSRWQRLREWLRRRGGSADSQ